MLFEYKIVNFILGTDADIGNMFVQHTHAYTHSGSYKREL